jgi:hypothetical protein
MNAELTLNPDNLLENIERILDPFLIDFQEEILKAVLARIPQRRVAYEAEIDRDNALGELSIAVGSSGLSVREQITYFKKTKEAFLKANRGRNGGKKQNSR